jgi:hypothetical protein
MDAPHVQVSVVVADVACQAFPTAWRRLACQIVEPFEVRWAMTSHAGRAAVEASFRQQNCYYIYSPVSENCQIVISIF